MEGDDEPVVCGDDTEAGDSYGAEDYDFGNDGDLDAVLSGEHGEDYDEDALLFEADDGDTQADEFETMMAQYRSTYSNDPESKPASTTLLQLVQVPLCIFTRFLKRNHSS